ncbi:MAG: FKBP-type peptidyl-prolyl cis-trans isomerase [Rhodospirillaceae bacterium]
MLRVLLILAAFSVALPALAQSDEATEARAAANLALLNAKGRAPANAIAGTTFMVLKSGPASGAHPTRTSAIKVRYEGSFLEGELFDTSYGKETDDATIFPLRALIPGFVSAVMMMKPGDEWLVSIPPEMAYGSVGHPLAGKHLFFKIELVDHAEMAPTPSPIMKRLPGRKSR